MTARVATFYEGKRASPRGVIARVFVVIGASDYTEGPYYLVISAHILESGIHAAICR